MWEQLTTINDFAHIISYSTVLWLLLCTFMHRFIFNSFRLIKPLLKSEFSVEKRVSTLNLISHLDFSIENISNTGEFTKRN